MEVKLSLRNNFFNYPKLPAKNLFFNAEFGEEMLFFLYSNKILAIFGKLETIKI